MYSYIAHLYLRNDSIHEHNTRGCHELRVLPGAKTFSNISARIWNVPSNKINCFSGKNEFASTWTRTRVVRLPFWCSTTELQSETSFHRLCCAFIVSVSLHSPPDEPHVVSLVVKNLEQRIRNLHSESVETIKANC